MTIVKNGSGKNRKWRKAHRDWQQTLMWPTEVKWTYTEPWGTDEGLEMSRRNEEGSVGKGGRVQ